MQFQTIRLYLELHVLLLRIFVLWFWDWVLSSGKNIHQYLLWSHLFLGFLRHFDFVPCRYNTLDLLFVVFMHQKFGGSQSGSLDILNCQYSKLSHFCMGPSLHFLHIWPWIKIGSCHRRRWKWRRKRRKTKKKWKW